MWKCVYVKVCVMVDVERKRKHIIVVTSVNFVRFLFFVFVYLLLPEIENMALYIQLHQPESSELVHWIQVLHFSPDRY